MRRQGLSSVVLIPIVLAILLSGSSVVNGYKYLDIYFDAVTYENVRVYSRYANLEEEQVNLNFNTYLTSYVTSHVTSKELVLSDEESKILNESINDFRRNCVEFTIIDVDETTYEARIYVSKTKLFSEILKSLNNNVTTIDGNYNSNFVKSIGEAVENTEITGRFEMVIVLDYDEFNNIYSIKSKDIDRILQVMTGL